MGVYSDFRKRVAELKSMDLPIQEFPERNTALLFRENFNDKDALVLMAYEDTVYVSLIYTNVKLRSEFSSIEILAQDSIIKLYKLALRDHNMIGDCAFRDGTIAFKIDVLDQSIDTETYLSCLLGIVKKIDSLVAGVYY